MSGESVTVTVTPGSAEVGTIYLLHDYPGVKVVYMDMVTKNPDTSMTYGDGEAEVLLAKPVTAANVATNSTTVVIKFVDRSRAWSFDLYAARYTVVVVAYKFGDVSAAPVLWEGRL